jgi:hypothetical protein
MRKTVTFTTLAVLMAAAAAAQQADATARRAIEVMAGPAWEKARYFEFTMAVDRGNERAAAFPQRWDRVTGEYRVSGRDQKGNDFVVVMNSKTRKGRAWLNGEEVKDSRLDETLALGYRRFVNDTFWLLMPLTMLDPGAHRTAEGERTDSCGRTWDVVKLTYDNGGFSPGDTYWAWINRDSGLVEEWDMKLAGVPDEEPPLSVMFHDYARFEGVLISTRRELRNKNQTVRIEALRVAAEVPKGAFATAK